VSRRCCALTVSVCGSRRFTPCARGSCAVNAIIWKDAGAEAPYASSRIKVSLRPGEMVELDHGALRETMNLLCGADASTLTAVAPAELILTGATDSRK